MSEDSGKNRRRHPDFVKISDYGDFKSSVSIWVGEDKATLVVSVYENGKWVQKLKELARWR